MTVIMFPRALRTRAAKSPAWFGALLARTAYLPVLGNVPLFLRRTLFAISPARCGRMPRRLSGTLARRRQVPMGGLIVALVVMFGRHWAGLRGTLMVFGDFGMRLFRHLLPRFSPPG
jgi:hypothetical protein